MTLRRVLSARGQTRSVARRIFSMPRGLYCGLAIPFVVFACSSQSWGAPMSIFESASGPAKSINELFLLVAAVCAGILAIVAGVLIYCIVRFRENPGTRSEPPQIYGSNPIEIAWTVGPVLIVFVLFLVVVRTVVEARHAPLQGDPMVVRVIGHQWWWEFRYPGLGVVTANELHVPVDRPEVKAVRLDLESVDVVHSFWIPRLAGKTDVIPGRTNLMDIAPYTPGTYVGQCAEYCGTQHANMMIRVIAEDRRSFENWVQAQRQPATSQPAAPGQTLFVALTCVNCHAIAGTAAAGSVGPDLTHLMTRETLAATELPNTRENLARWLADPQRIKPGCKMPDLNLSTRDIGELVAYLETLR